MKKKLSQVYFNVKINTILIKKTKADKSMPDKDYQLLEKQAHSLFANGQFDSAYQLFKETGAYHKQQKNYSQAALCFASAASCWGIRSGEKTFFEAASLYEEAAKQAQAYFDYEYAAMLYRSAAINYERDGEFLNFSDCFYYSKECYRKFLFHTLTKSKKIPIVSRSEDIKGFKGFVKGIIFWFFLAISCLIWGHGERPSRTLYSVMRVILISAILYSMGVLAKDGLAFNPNIFESIYFSVVTFTTVGYGDIVPVGISRFVAMMEVLSGMFIMPLFVVGLSRKYLRV